MDLSKTFRSDAKLRDEGVWVDLPGTTDGTQIRVRTEDYAPYRRAITMIVERNQGQGRFSRRTGSTLPDPVKFDIDRGKVIAEHLLVDWKGIQNGGEDVPFSKDAAENFLTDPDYYDFYLAVTEAIDTVTRQRQGWEDGRKKS